MRKQHIHVCIHHMHTHINTYEKEVGMERESSSGFGFDDFGSLRMILKVQAMKRVTGV